MRPLAVLVVSAALLLPGSAGGTATTATALAAVGLRAGNHPGFVRVVVDLRGARLNVNSVDATDPDPFNGTARLVVQAPGAASFAAPLVALGVEARVTSGGPGLRIALGARFGRFKYLSYAVVHRPERLAIDLWKSAPPVRRAVIRRGERGCLVLGRHAVGGGLATAAGRERDLFEHSFVVRLRGAGGGVVARRIVTATGPWSVRFRYRARHQPGTLEAVALSAKDGSLDCLVQVRVRL